jgi:hypothetical protein
MDFTPVVRKLDDFGVDADVEAAAAAIDLDHARGVGLHHRARERAALLGLNLGLELLVLDLLVALERDAVDHRVLDHGDGQAPARHRGTNILEQAGRKQRLDAFVDLECVEPAARSGLEI